jgi:hypothetical protein
MPGLKGLAETMDRRPVNHYVLVGSGVDGVIDTSSVIGQPSVAIRIDEKPLDGAEVRESEHGVEVAALVEQVPDSHTVYLRLVVPTVNVEAEPLPFAGLAVLTTARTPLSPSLVEGAVHQYEVRPVGGTAEALDF